MTGWERLGIGSLSQGFLRSAEPYAGLAAGEVPAPPLAGRVMPTHGYRIVRRRVATHNVRANAPSNDFGSLPIPSLVLPSNEHALQRDPNEVTISM